MSLRAKFVQIEKELNGTLAEREREVHGVMVALLAREHVLILGPAGTAKSALAHTACAAIEGAAFFQHLLTRFSPPEEIFGPVSLDGLKHDVFRRVTTNKLPEAHVSFLDEIFKANSAVLNSLLTALNERAFDNDGGRRAIPLETMVGASNELPEGPELAALYDRFLLRFWTQYTKTPEAFRRLITGNEPAIATRLTLDELHQAQHEAESMPVSDAAVEELFKLREEIRVEGIVASDRRWRKCVRILRAAAWLEGMTEVTPEAFPILAHCLWDTTAQIAQLSKVVSKYTSAELAEATAIADAMAEMEANLPAAGAEKYLVQLSAITKEMRKARERVSAYAKACKGAQSKARIQTIAESIDAKLTKLKRQAAKDLEL